MDFKDVIMLECNWKSSISQNQWFVGQMEYVLIIYVVNVLVKMSVPSFISFRGFISRGWWIGIQRVCIWWRNLLFVPQTLNERIYYKLAGIKWIVALSYNWSISVIRTNWSGIEGCSMHTFTTGKYKKLLLMTFFKSSREVPENRMLFDTLC